MKYLLSILLFLISFITIDTPLEIENQTKLSAIEAIKNNIYYRENIKCFNQFLFEKDFIEIFIYKDKVKCNFIYFFNGNVSSTMVNEVLISIISKSLIFKDEFNYFVRIEK